MNTSDTHALLLNIFGGALVVIFVELYRLVSRMCRNWALKRLMGFDFARRGSYRIVYGSFDLPPVYSIDGVRVSHPFIKTPLPVGSHRTQIPVAISIEHSISSGEMRGCAYLAEFFGKWRVCPPSIVSDSSIDSLLDTSFISLGGPSSNYKTDDVLGNGANTLLLLDNHRFMRPKTRECVYSFSPDPKYDYGMILRISPTQHPSRTWIVCAGFGEWGTSGACWFLSNKWRKLFWYLLKGFDRNYAAIIKVVKGQDESAELVWKDKTRQ